MKFKLFWFSLLAFFLLAIFYQSCTRIDKKSGIGIEQIALEDRKILSAFFEILIKHEEGGFTLFGKKPITFAEYLLPQENAVIDKETIIPLLLEEGWKVFQKYPQLFVSNNFLLKRSINPKDRLSIVYLTLVNKKIALNVIEEHLDLFKEVYGSKFNPKNYLESLEEVAWEEPKLAGILLGYGRKSAWAFHRIREIPLYYNTHPEVLEKELELLTDASKKANSIYSNIGVQDHQVSDFLKPSPGFPSLADELNYINEHYSFFELDGTDFTCSPFSSFGFRCLDNDEEVAKLQSAYQETLSILNKSYDSKPFLQVTLEQWQKD